MKFTDTTTARTYSDRRVNSSWVEWCKNELAPHGKVVVDIGCGGGIYSQGFLECEAASVFGIDSSEQYIDEARSAHPNCVFSVAQCHDTGLESMEADIVFERALIHHLKPAAMRDNAKEMLRVLRNKGVALIQDRTQEDVAAVGEAFWIRRELINMFPRLLDFEAQRRPKVNEYTQILEEVGFDAVEVNTYSEVRKVYDSKQQLVKELQCRKGKSILFELSDEELGRYIDRIISICPDSEIIECDRWTIWKAIRSSDSRK